MIATLIESFYRVWPHVPQLLMAVSFAVYLALLVNDRRIGALDPGAFRLGVVSVALANGLLAWGGWYDRLAVALWNGLRELG